MLRKTWNSLMIAILLISLFGAWAPAAAQSEIPGGVPETTPESQGPLASPARAEFSQAALAGNPDLFGYQWRDRALTWVDATPGEAINLSPGNRFSAPIALPFPFKFYENTYAQAWISVSGYITFQDPRNFPVAPPTTIPSPNTPNAFIAPYYTAGISGTVSTVHYMAGGVEPSRYFIVQWQNLTSGNDVFTFQVILGENGDILFQYKDMNINGTWSCGTAGMEDADGITGLLTLPYCARPTANTGVLITRPAPQARLKTYLLKSDTWLSGGKVATADVLITNNGELGTDTYNFAYPSNWKVILLRADRPGTITDTDGDGRLDSGPLEPGQSMRLRVQVLPPVGYNPADSNTVNLTISSKLNPAVSQSTPIRAAIPVPFASVFRENFDASQRLFLSTPGQILEPVAGYNQYSINTISMAPTSDGNYLVVWPQIACLDTACTINGSELYYAVLSVSGTVVRPATKLTEHSGSAYSIFDDNAVVAVAPDGSAGIFWTENAYDGKGNENHNVFLLMLDAGGNVKLEATNLTNITTWLPKNEDGFIYHIAPHIVATTDNRFVISWVNQTVQSNDFLDDVYFGIISTAGGVIKPVTKLTNAVLGTYYYDFPLLLALNGGRFMLGYVRFSTVSGSQVYFNVFDSSGALVKGETALPAYPFSPAAAQLPSGLILVAWLRNPSSAVEYALLDGSTYSIIPTGAGSFTSLSNPVAISGMDNLSVTTDQNDHFILTFGDGSASNDYRLYTAVVGSDGTALVPPTVYRTAKTDANDFYSLNGGMTGQGSAPLLVTGPNEADLALSVSPVAVGPAGGLASTSLQLTNLGLTSALSVTISTTLPLSVTYVADNSGITPEQVGNQLIWHLPALDWQGGANFVVSFGLPMTTTTTTYLMTFVASTAATETNVANNSDQTRLAIGQQAFLPAVMSFR